MTDADLLEGMDGIPWAELEHAYGPATNVPAMLQAVVGHDEGARAQAIADLFHSICHQGTVYGATSAAVPFIARTARDGRLSDPERQLLVGLLAYIAAGRGYWLVHGTVPAQASRRPTDPEVLTRERREVAAAREAVAHEFSALVQRLGGDNGRVDWNLSFAASQVGVRGAAAVPLVNALAERTAESHLLAALSLTRDLVDETVTREIVEAAARSLDETDRAQADAERLADPERWPRTVAELLFEEGFENDPVR
jgi:hypothetical protein